MEGNEGVKQRGCGKKGKKSRNPLRDPKLEKTNVLIVNFGY